MLFSSAGAAGQIVAFVFAVGLPVQLALAALLALGRRIGGTTATFVPTVCLAAGLVGLTQAVDAALAAVGGSADPAWIPWFAVQDRARAAAASALGAGAALILVLPPAFGAAVRALRAGPRRWWAAATGAGVGLFAAVGMLVTGAVVDRGLDLLVPAVALALLSVAAGLAVSEAAPAGVRAPPLVAARVGGATFLFGGLSLVVAWLSLTAFGAAVALPDFDAPFSRVGALDAHSLAARTAPWLVIPFVLLAGLGILPGLFLRKVSHLPPAVGADALSVGGQALFLALLGGWVTFRWEALSHLAGEHAAAVLEDRGEVRVPLVAPVPARVLRLEPAQPRWIVLREGGGIEIAAGVGPLEEVAQALQRGDGLVLPPDMTAEDLYFTLADVDAGELSLVGCDEVTADAWARIQRDPLLAVGRCGAFPLSLRVVGALEEPRQVIALKDGWVDDGGDVVPVAELAPERGDVLLRAQADARVADIAAVLERLRGARRVYLAWGVTLDGDAIPVGVNPGLRIRLDRAAPEGGAAPAEVPAAPSPNGQSPAPSAVPTPPPAPSP